MSNQNNTEIIESEETQVSEYRNEAIKARDEEKTNITTKEKTNTTKETSAIRKPNESEEDVTREIQVKTSDNENEEEGNRVQEIGSDEWFIDDQKKFQSKFPDINSDELFSDPIFLEFAEKRVGSDSMVDIYETYLSIRGRIEAKVMEKAEDEFRIRLANAKASPGSLTDNTKVSDRLFTFDELKRMSSDSIERNWEKVQKSIKSFGK